MIRLKALQLESLGMKRRGKSVLSIIKKETGLKARTAAEMIPLYTAWLRERGIIQ